MPKTASLAHRRAGEAGSGTDAGFGGVEEKLKAANDRLNKLVAERDMLLSEVNHRAKNSLAVAASLLAIQGRRQPDRAVRALFEEAQDRLNAMARVHDLLSKSESAQQVTAATSGRSPAPRPQYPRRGALHRPPYRRDKRYR